MGDFLLRGNGIKYQDWVIEFNLKPLKNEEFNARDYTSRRGFGKVGDLSACSHSATTGGGTFNSSELMATQVRQNVEHEWEQ